MWKKYFRTLRWPCLLAALLALSGTSEAGVTLVPRVNSSGDILKDERGVAIASEDYVLFGKFKHRLVVAAGDQETAATPILWRAMSLDISPNPTKAVLLSHHLLEGMAYQRGARGDSRPQNTWEGSQVQKWLNDASPATAYDVYLTKNYRARPSTPLGAQVEGFLHHFAPEERNALQPYPDGTANSGVSLPSGSANVYETTAANPTFYPSEIVWWFGPNNGPNNDARGAYFKNKNSTRFFYWMRTPDPDGTDRAVLFGEVGLAGLRLFSDNVYDVHSDNGFSVRPVLLLNLESLLFKTASGDFAPSFDPAAAPGGGGETNPWILVLGGLAPADGATRFASADLPPSGAAIDATGKIMTVRWAAPISPAVRRWPASADFTFARPGGVGSNPVSVTSDDIDRDILILTFANATMRGESVTLGYNLNTDAISCDKSGTAETDVVGSFTLDAAKIVNNSTVAPPDPGPTPSGETKPGSVSATADGAKHDGQLQADGRTYLIVVPWGTDISNLSVDVTPPKGGAVSPDMPVSHDFTKGPLAFTVTAEDGTKKSYTVDVKIEEQKQPTERALFTFDVNGCEVVVARNADGTYAVKIRIPFASAPDASLLDTVRAIASLFNLANVSYSVVNADGSETPVAPLQSPSSARRPYLEISGTAAGMSAIENGAITQIRYTLQNDGTQYVQTFPVGGLKIASMPGYPSLEPTPSGSSSSGCDAGARAFALIAIMGGAMLWRRK